MVALVPMTEADFHAYRNRAITEYAQEHIRAGRWSVEEADQKAESEYQQLLPQGLVTLNHFLYSMQDTTTHTTVGILWFAIEACAAQDEVFVYDMEINPQFQRQGYGVQAMVALENEVRRRGFSTIRLHVFGHNHAARALYEKLGYVPTNITMKKNLAPRRAPE